MNAIEGDFHPSLRRSRIQIFFLKTCSEKSGEFWYYSRLSADQSKRFFDEMLINEQFCVIRCQDFLCNTLRMAVRNWEAISQKFICSQNQLIIAMIFSTYFFVPRLSRLDILLINSITKYIEQYIHQLESKIESVRQEHYLSNTY